MMHLLARVGGRRRSSPRTTGRSWRCSAGGIAAFRSPRSVRSDTDAQALTEEL